MIIGKFDSLHLEQKTLDMGVLKQPRGVFAVVG